MKPRDLIFPLIIIPLGLAFLFAGLMLIFRPDSRRIIALKMRPGAFLLSFSFMAACSTPPPVTCYKPAPPENSVVFDIYEAVSPGDTLRGRIYQVTYDHLIYEIFSVDDRQMILNGRFTDSAGTAVFRDGWFRIATNGDMRSGNYILRIMGEYKDVSDKRELDHKEFTVR